MKPESIKPGDILRSIDNPGFNWGRTAISAHFDAISLEQQEEVKANLIMDNIYEGAHRPNISFKVLSIKGGFRHRALSRILDGTLEGKYIDLCIDGRLELVGSDPDDNY